VDVERERGRNLESIPRRKAFRQEWKRLNSDDKACGPEFRSRWAWGWRRKVLNSENVLAPPPALHAAYRGVILVEKRKRSVCIIPGGKRALGPRFSSIKEEGWPKLGFPPLVSIYTSPPVVISAIFKL